MPLPLQKIVGGPFPNTRHAEEQRARLLQMMGDRSGPDPVISVYGIPDWARSINVERRRGQIILVARN
jgi:hypothetical protein